MKDILSKVVSCETQTQMGKEKKGENTLSKEKTICPRKELFVQGFFCLTKMICPRKQYLYIKILIGQEFFLSKGSHRLPLVADGFPKEKTICPRKKLFV